MIGNSHITRRMALLSFAATVFLPSKIWAAWPLVTVHKDPTCGCCGGPFELAACHTAQVGGYLIEGHVPAKAIQTLLTERPKAQGLAVPGMPSGSPGMTGEYEEYDVILFGSSERRVFARFKGETQI